MRFKFQSRAMVLCVVLSLTAAAQAAPVGATEAAAVPDLDARITYDSRVATNDGVTKTGHFQERFIRRAGHVWAERVFPYGIPPQDPHAAVNALGQHGEFDASSASRHITLAPDGQLQLDCVTPQRSMVVHIPPGNFNLVGFADTWESSRALIEPAGLKAMKKTGRASPVPGAEWHEQTQGERFVRVLWSPRQHMALRIESGTRDGREWRRTEVQLEPLTPAARLPWIGLDQLPQRDYEDFSD
jgi:hypothetical protein